MQLLFELYSSFAPTLATILFAPVVLVIMSFSKIYQLISLGGGEVFSFPIYMAPFFSVGIIFTGILYLKAWRKYKKKPQPILTLKKLLPIWLLLAIFGFIATLVSQPLDTSLGQPYIVPILQFAGLFFIGIGHIVAFYSVVLGTLYVILKKWKPKYIQHLSEQRWVKGVAIIVILYPLTACILGLFILFMDEFDNPQAQKFFVLHAAIKNTCFFDPQKVNCPHSVEEIGYIEPEQFAMAKSCCQLQYMYVPEINQYSFVVRYHPNKAVVFDWRFQDKIGLDFKEFAVNSVGQDRLVDPPEWDGPWTFPDWNYL